MKIDTHFHTAPPVQRWAELLANSGWKLVVHDTERLRAQKRIGQSEYPVRNAVTWYVDITEADTGVRVQIEVPTFIESRTAEDRLLSQIASLAERIDGSCETDASLSVDLLNHLRKRR